MQRIEKQNEHERFHEQFKELCALAQADSLSEDERVTLERHLMICESCRQAYEAYSMIGEEGMAFLAANYAAPEDARGWDNRQARQRLFASIRDQRPNKVLAFATDSQPANRGLHVNTKKSWMMIASVAACMMFAVALGAYHLGKQKKVVSQQVATILPSASPTPVDKTSAEVLNSQRAQIARLEEELNNRENELTRLQAESSQTETRLKQLGTVDGEREAQLRQLTAERDKLASQLGESERAYQSLQVELVNLRATHSQDLLHVASLESKVEDLTSTGHDQDRRLKDAEQYLVSDRDIRELMGARKLYIADVFDVDSGSRTRKPFGRVFYTQSKSLVFYAFDLDHEPGVKNASTFQVWGQRDSESNAEAHPTNLGILYMDSESNRRWVLRSDDPKQLAEIDAVFVTVEPHGGSQKPTGKPFLYALLRKEANHP